MATKKLVPRATNEGGLGTALKVWGPSWLQNLVITNLQASTSVSGLVENNGNVEKRNLTTVGIDVQDTNDPTAYVGLWEAATGTLLPKTDGELRYNATADILQIGKAGIDLWISSGYITQYFKHLKVKVKGGINITSSYGKVRIFGGITPLASFYSIYGTWIHLLQTELTPAHIITEAVPGGSSTNVPNGMKGVLCRTPIANLVPNLQSLDEGSSLTTTTQSINYVGAGVTATVGSSNDTTVTIPGTSSVLDTEDDTCFVGLYEAATGNLLPKTDEALTYDALANILSVGSSTINTSYYANNVLAKGAPFSLRSVNNTVALSANLGMTIHDDSDNIRFLSGGTPAQVGKLTSAGLFIDNIPSEPAPVNIIVDNSTTPGLFSKIAISALPTQLIAVQDTEVTTCSLALFEAATGTALAPKTDEGLTYNAQTGSELLSIGGDILMGDGTHNDMAIIDVKIGNTGINGNKLRLIGGDSGAGTNLKGGNVGILTGIGTGTGINPIIQFTGAKQVAAGTGIQAGQAIAYLQHSGDGGSVSYNLFAMPSPLSGNDIFEISTYRDGATIIKTLHGSSSATSAHLVLDADGDTSFKKTGTTLATVESLRTESFMMACSDETTALTTGTGKVTFRMPYAFTVTDIRASLTTAGTGANLVTVDVNNGGSTILTNKVTLDATEKTSTTAATAFSFTSAAAALLADDAEISIDIDQIDSGGVSKGLKVAIIGHKTV